MERRLHIVNFFLQIFFFIFFTLFYFFVQTGTNGEQT